MSKNNFGASKVSFNFFKNWEFADKKLFQFTLKRDKSKNRNIKNIILFTETPIIKLLYLPIIIINVYRYLKNKKNPILIIEGASWIFYSLITFVILKNLIKNLKVIYHGHNVEYEVRKNKINFIKRITFFSEKFIYKNANLATVVSKRDWATIKFLYKIKPYIFLNGYCLNKVKQSKFTKIKLPKIFLLFNGSYSYWPNKVAIDKIINVFCKKILKVNDQIYFVFTGHNFPDKYKINKNIIYLEDLSDEDYRSVLLKSNLLFLPLPKSPGTKIKVIEALCEGKNIVGSKSSFLGIDLCKEEKKFIFLNNSDAVIKIFKSINSVNSNNKAFYRNKYLYKNIVNKLLNENYEIFFKKHSV